MTSVLMNVCRLVETDFPRRLEVRLTDAHGREWVFIDKEPVFLAEPVRVAALPYEVAVMCQVLSVHEDLVRITTAKPWGLETEEGESEFDVVPAQLSETEPPKRGCANDTRLTSPSQ